MSTTEEEINAKAEEKARKEAAQAEKEAAKREAAERQAKEDSMRIVSINRAAQELVDAIGERVKAKSNLDKATAKVRAKSDGFDALLDSPELVRYGRTLLKRLKAD